MAYTNLSPVFFGHTAWFVSDLVENPKDRFSHDVALNDS